MLQTRAGKYKENIITAKMNWKNFYELRLEILLLLHKIFTIGDEDGSNEILSRVRQVGI